MESNDRLTRNQPLEENAASQFEEEKMEWKCFEDNQTRGSWRVEATDFQDEGNVYVAIFDGPNAQQRAKEYAEWKSSARQLQVA